MSETKYIRAYVATWVKGAAVLGEDNFIAGNMLNALSIAARRTSWQDYINMPHVDRLAITQYGAGLPSSAERLVAYMSINSVTLRVAAISAFFPVPLDWTDHQLPGLLHPVPCGIVSCEIDENLYIVLAHARA